MSRFDQVGIAVEDLDAALGFSAGAFGLTSSAREQVASDGVGEAMIDIGGVQPPLLQSIREGPPIERFLASRGPGMHHLGIAVRSLDAALAHLRTEGIGMIDEDPDQRDMGHG